MLAGKLGGVRLFSLIRQVEDPSGMPEHTLRKLSEEVLDYPSSSPGRVSILLSDVPEHTLRKTGKG